MVVTIPNITNKQAIEIIKAIELGTPYVTISKTYAVTYYEIRKIMRIFDGARTEGECQRIREQVGKLNKDGALIRKQINYQKYAEFYAECSSHNLKVSRRIRKQGISSIKLDEIRELADVLALMLNEYEMMTPLATSDTKDVPTEPASLSDSGSDIDSDK